MEFTNLELKDKEVLVLEDNIVAKRAVQRALHMIGIKKVHMATCVDDTKNILRKNRVDLIISDIHLEEDNGLDFLKSIKESSRYKKLPFIIVTSDIAREEFDKALQLGVSDYILKPVTPEILEDKILNIFEVQRP
ncbi:MAG: response regulator [Deltaproteobacteria bacterium]|nr:response regulator [Deltaproteobacteria bacterium]